jgi:abortive infection bacteriophage resistance protein
MQYSKPTLSIAEQVSRLSERGLEIVDVPFAENTLKFISYYRLRAYTYPFQDNVNPNHPFIYPVSFEEIIKLYEFDRDLRLLMYNAIERIEIAFRALIIYNFAMSHGSHWYQEPTIYRNNQYFEDDLASIDKELSRSDEEFIKHYFNKYHNPVRPPAWMTLEVATFTTLSKLYQNLRHGLEKKKIARNLGLNYLILENWMHVLSNVRNICAHHSRLYNRTLSQAISIPGFTYNNLWLPVNYKIENNKMYAVLCITTYLFDRILPSHDFRKKIADLFAAYPNVQPHLLKFPKDWQNEKFWKA